jgi:hypothetical protein
MDRAVTPSLDTTPPLNVTVPDPNPAGLITKTTPPLTVVPPENVFATSKVIVPEPLFTNAPVPLITPETKDAPLPPTVNVLDCKLTVPVPFKVPMVSFEDNLSVAPEFT